MAGFSQYLAQANPYWMRPRFVPGSSLLGSPPTMPSMPSMASQMAPPSPMPAPTGGTMTAARGPLPLTGRDVWGRGLAMALGAGMPAPRGLGEAISNIGSAIASAPAYAEQFRQDEWAAKLKAEEDERKRKIEDIRTKAMLEEIEAARAAREAARQRRERQQQAGESYYARAASEGPPTYRDTVLADVISSGEKSPLDVIEKETELRTAQEDAQRYLGGIASPTPAQEDRARAIAGGQISILQARQWDAQDQRSARSQAIDEEQLGMQRRSHELNIERAVRERDEAMLPGLPAADLGQHSDKQIQSAHEAAAEAVSKRFLEDYRAGYEKRMREDPRAAKEELVEPYKYVPEAHPNFGPAVADEVVAILQRIDETKAALVEQQTRQWASKTLALMNSYATGTATGGSLSPSKQSTSPSPERMRTLGIQALAIELGIPPDVLTAWYNAERSKASHLNPASIIMLLREKYRRGVPE